MKKFKQLIKDNILSLSITFVIALLVQLAFFLVYILVWYKPNYYNCSNGGFIIGSLTLAFGLLMLLGSYGTFDMFGYGFGYLGRMIFAYKEKPKYKDYIEYKDVKNKTREKASPLYLSVIISSLLIIIIALIFQFLYIVERTNANL